MGWVVAIATFCVIGAIAAGIAYVQHKAEKKRTEELRQAAANLEFDFAAQGDDALLQSLKRFHLFSQGHSHKLWNLMRGRARGLEVAIFDYRYVTGSGKSTKRWNQSVICFRIDGPALPTFALRPEDVWHKIGQWFGYQDMDFESRPMFSKIYLLRGDDEAAIRALFRDEVLEFYEQNPGLSTEGGGDTLVYYQTDLRREPSAMGDFLQEAFQALAVIRPRA